MAPSSDGRAGGRAGGRRQWRVATRQQAPDPALFDGVAEYLDAYGFEIDVDAARVTRRDAAFDLDDVRHGARAAAVHLTRALATLQVEPTAERQAAREAPLPPRHLAV